MVDELDYDDLAQGVQDFKQNFGIILAIWGWQFTLGDARLNDGLANFGDLVPFTEVLTNFQTYGANRLAENPQLATIDPDDLEDVVRMMVTDINGDGLTNFGGRVPFVDLLQGGILPVSLTDPRPDWDV